MKKQIVFMMFAAGLLTGAMAQNPRLIPFASDAETGISTNKIYTHAVDMGSSHDHPVINHVQFTSSNSPNNSAVPGWNNFPKDSVPIVAGNIGGIATPEGNAIRTLLGDLNYNLDNGTMTVTGMTPGHAYEFRFYNRAWEAGFTRTQRITFIVGGIFSEPFVFNPDAEKLDQMLAYRYVAPESGELQIQVNQLGGGTFHVYGFSNELTCDIETSGATFVGNTFATLNGSINPSGYETTIWAQIKVNDGDDSDAAWQSPDVVTVAVDGTFDAAADFSVALAADTFSASTTYAYRFAFSNDYMVGVSDTATFETRSDTPAIFSRDPQDISGDSATTAAWIDYILDDAADGATVELFWGTRDGGADAGAWSNRVDLGTQSLGEVTHTLSGLRKGVEYYYRHRIGNGVETAWAPETVRFMLALSIYDNPRIVLFAGDEASEISDAKTYTHAVDFGSVENNPVVNGVAFVSTKSASGTMPDTAFAWSGFQTTAHDGNGGTIYSGTDQAVYQLLLDFNYEPQSSTMSVDGLEAGRLYEIRFYQRKWGGARSITFTFRPDNDTATAFAFEPETYTQDTFLAFMYRAPENGTLIIDYVGNISGNTYHCYGFSNELVGSLRLLPETALGDTFATLGGNVFPVGVPTTVTLQIKVDDNDDSDAAWQSQGVTTVAVAGEYETNSTFSVTLDNLAVGTTYAYRFVLDNGFNVIPSEVGTFETRASTPVIYSTEAADITPTSAVATAWIDYIASGVTDGATVEIFWGDEDGGDSDTAWDKSEVIAGTHALGAVAFSLTNQNYATEYFYRHRIGNGIETAWSPETVRFTTRGLPSFETPLVVPYSESVYFGVRLANAGVSATTVSLLFGETAETLTPVKTWPATQSTAHFAHIINALANGTTYYYAFRAETEMPDAPGVPRVVQTPVSAVTVANNALPSGTATWTGNGGDQRWSNPLNWSTGAIPGPYNRVHITNDNLPEEDRAVYVDGPFVIGDLTFAANTALRPGADDASLTLLNTYIGGGNGHVISVPLFLGRSSNWQSNDSWGGSVTVSGPVSDYGIGATVYTTGNQNNNANIRGPWDIAGSLFVQNMGTYMDNDFTITNAVGVYIAGWAYHNGAETTLNLNNTTPRSNRFAPGVALGVHPGSGSFNFNGHAEVPVRENISVLDLTGGRLSLNIGGAAETILHVENIRRGTGATVWLGLSGNGRFSVAGARNRYGAIWQPWAMFYNHYATVNQDGFIVSTTDNDYVELAAAGNATDALAQLTAAELTLAAPAEVAGLRFNTAQTQTLDLGDSDLAVASGALIACGGSEKRIDASGNGALVFGGDDIVVHSDNGAHTFDIAAPVAWAPTNPDAPARPCLILPRVNNSGAVRFSGEDNIGDYDALTCFPSGNGSGTSLILDGPSDRTFHGPFTGLFNLHKYGTGTLRLNGPGYLRGGSVLLCEGTVVYGNASAVGISSAAAGTTLAVAAGITYNGFPGTTEPGLTLGGFGTFGYQHIGGSQLKPGSRIAPGDAANIGTLTFGGALGYAGEKDQLGTLFFDIKLDGEANDRVHIANDFYKPASDSVWTFVVRDLSHGKTRISPRTEYVVMTWTGGLGYAENTFDLDIDIHPGSRSFIGMTANTEIRFDPDNKRIVVTGLQTPPSVIIVR